MKSENRCFILDMPGEYGLKRSIKLGLKKIMIAYYGLNYKFNRMNDARKCKYYVSICCIFKNEAVYLKEWIEFGLTVGIEHFFMYNNNSTDDYQEVLKPYIDAGIVTLIRWEKNQAQMECYQDAIVRYKDETKWLGFIDVDEFIVPNTNDSISDFLKQFERFPAVIVYWKMFCSSGMLERNVNGLVTEDFVVSWQKYSDIGKCFYNTAFDFDTDYFRNANLHHKMWGSRNGKHYPPVNVFGKVCIDELNPYPHRADSNNFPIQINHYFTKSLAEYLQKKSKGDVYFVDNPHDMEYFFYHDMKCQFTDYHAYKYLIKLKNRLRKNS